MTKGDIELATRRAHNIFDEWNNTTGIVVKGSGYYFELLGVITDAVHCGAQQATGDFKKLESEE